MHTREVWNCIEEGLLPIESVDNRSMISPVTLVDIYPPSNVINMLLKIILNTI